MPWPSQVLKIKFRKLIVLYTPAGPVVTNTMENANSQTENLSAFVSRDTGVPHAPIAHLTRTAQIKMLPLVSYPISAFVPHPSTNMKTPKNCATEIKPMFRSRRQKKSNLTQLDSAVAYQVKPSFEENNSARMEVKVSQKFVINTFSSLYPKSYVQLKI